MMKLYKTETGERAKVGETVTSFRGEKATLESWAEPRTAASTGRVYVKESGGWRGEYYPSVYGLEFRKEES